MLHPKCNNNATKPCKQTMSQLLSNNECHGALKKIDHDIELLNKSGGSPLSRTIAKGVDPNQQRTFPRLECKPSQISRPSKSAPGSRNYMKGFRASREQLRLSGEIRVNVQKPIDYLEADRRQPTKKKHISNCIIQRSVEVVEGSGTFREEQALSNRITSSASNLVGSGQVQSRKDNKREDDAYADKTEEEFNKELPQHSEDELRRLIQEVKPPETVQAFQASGDQLRLGKQTLGEIKEVDVGIFVPCTKSLKSKVSFRATPKQLRL